MKYYYNGELVRTSKNENYKYYCPLTKSCSKTRDGALKDVRYYMNSAKKDLAFCKEALNKLEKGIKTKDYITGDYYTSDELQKYIKSYETAIVRYLNAEVVELETRP